MIMGHNLSQTSVVNREPGHRGANGGKLYKLGENHVISVMLKVIYHPLYSMNNFVTNKSKLPQDGAHVFPYMG